ncbi:hypothetical protein [Shewanella xiamenensis]|uniref:hypothetical protein n=1 Tax=Shewanella xiamenensis TaxID=332186 RepID=UPI0024A738A7|nr:hypothetical protein [Shewanella xiamenensis]MDI5837887.1 hypothetical protein [Shewanella xiamenensis]MDI5841743.1 hypothetical protein [Shewanella xiamenensis]MDI5845721.1 hypothetical protein [Shewanella xiamenensis]MDI5849595.1 hypothetical protein [Shewanella xiamenensis]MDI5853596.1 hypothetical protein [Shewanella xiamenensis]
MWEHNIFDDMIENDNDFVGKVAYSLYKQEKVGWVKHYHHKNNVYPTKVEIQKFFHEPAARPESIKRFRNEAEVVVNKFINITLSEELTSYKESLKDDAVLRQIKKPFKISVMENITAALLASIITASFSTAYWLYSEMQNSKRLEQLIKDAPITEEIKNNILKK